MAANQPVKKVTIVGGGTAGWMTAAVLSQWLSQVEVTLIESDEIGIIGVGEATIPHIRNLLALAGVDPLKMISAAKATFKLGIQFVDWGAPDWMPSLNVAPQSTNWMPSSSSIGERRAKPTST